MTTKVKTANDMISDSVDALLSGNEALAGQYFDDAINRKITDRFNDVLSKQPEFNGGDGCRGC